VVRDLGCLQLDPTPVVARSHLLVLWSRLGRFDTAELDRLLWAERALFEYWGHQASIVLTEDFPIHEATMMRGWPRGESAWAGRVRGWLEANDAARRYILDELAARGPLRSRDLEDRAAVPWESTGWTHARNVDRLLTFLWTAGEVCIAGRTGNARLWAAADGWLPHAKPIDEEEAVRRATVKAVRALGVATPRQIREHFIRGRYPGLARALAEGPFEQVEVENLRGPWYVHEDDLRLLEAPWEPRTTLLSPFDNLIADRARTEQLFGFEFRLEIYVPKEKRQYGYFVMPVLAGDRLAGRIDLRVDRKRRVLMGIPHDLDADVEAPLAELAAFAGADSVELSRPPVRARRPRPRG